MSVYTSNGRRYSKRIRYRIDQKKINPNGNKLEECCEEGIYKIKEYGVESAFAVLMIVTASAMAFAHGSNDVANAIGPMSAIISVASEGAIGAKAAVSPWVLLICLL